MRDYKQEDKTILLGKRQEVKRDLREWVKVQGSGYDVSLTCKSLVLLFGASRVNPNELVKEV
jgi:hypothetical protein